MASSRKSRGGKSITIHDNDVLNGRGVKIAQHPGNLRFRSLVKEMQDKNYCETFSSDEKKALAREIINHIKNKLNPPGRFLKRHGEGHWIELSRAEVEKKTKQALRDCNRSDRTGYAKQVTTPQDVFKADQERKMSGLSLQEHARSFLNDESKRTGTRGGKTNRKASPTSGAAFGSSKRSKPAKMSPSVPESTISEDSIKSNQLGEPIEWTEPLAPGPAESSTSGWAAAHSTVSTTPAARPFTNAAPVTMTPNPPNSQNSSFLQANGLDHHQHLSHSSIQPTMNSQPPVGYDNGYPLRNTFDHDTTATHTDNSAAAGFNSPVLRSPIVPPSIAPETTVSNTRAFEGNPEPFLDEWATGHHPQNLFPHADPLDSMAANASASLNNDRSETDFMMAFENTNDADVTGDNDLNF